MMVLVIEKFNTALLQVPVTKRRVTGIFGRKNCRPVGTLRCRRGEARSSLTGSLMFLCYSLIGSKKFPAPPSREFEKKMTVFR